MIFRGYSLVRHFLHEFQANLSLSNTTHSIQQKILPFLSLTIGTVREMLLEFGDDFYPACESNTWVWHEGNDPVRCPSVVNGIDVVL